MRRAAVVADRAAERDVAPAAGECERITAAVEIGDLHRPGEVDGCVAGGDIAGQVAGARARLDKAATRPDGHACFRGEIHPHQEVAADIGGHHAADADVAVEQNIAARRQRQVVRSRGGEVAQYAEISAINTDRPSNALCAGHRDVGGIARLAQRQAGQTGAHGRVSQRPS